MSIKSSIGRKFTMALSGLFLVVFLLQHFIINLTSVFSIDAFNEVSHFMGTNPLVQFALQPVLIFGVIYHFIMGIVLEMKNSSARSKKYTLNKGSRNSKWASRNMIFSGAVILSFLGLHFYDFWVPEIQYKYVDVFPADPTRYYEELVHKFHSHIRTILYVISFVFLSLHLLHGFNSSFQTVGFNNKFSTSVKTITTLFAILIPAGFIFIAFFHHINGLFS